MTTAAELLPQLSVEKAFPYLSQIPMIIFLGILIVPLYRLAAADRTAIYIMFSKTCTNTFYMCLNCGWFLLTTYFVPSQWLPPEAILAYKYPSQSALVTGYLHLGAMAINRFYAVFYPLEYTFIWKKRRTFMFICLAHFAGICLGIVQIASGIGNIFTIVQYVVLAIAALIYGSIIGYFLWRLIASKRNPTNVHQNNNNAKHSNSRQALEKDRILLCVLAFVGTIPMPLNYALQSLQTTYGADPQWVVAIAYLRSANYILLQCIEEFCLLLFCRDFRKQIRNVYFSSNGHNAQQMQQQNIINVMPATNSLKNT